MNEFKQLNEKLEKFMEMEWDGAAYDRWLDSQADAFNDPDLYEIRIYGTSLYDIKAKKPDGEIIELKNVPLYYDRTLDVSDEDETTGREHPAKWDYVYDHLDEYMDLSDLDYFDTGYDVAEKYKDKCIPEDYELEEILGFSEGHGIDDLEMEQA